MIKYNDKCQSNFSCVSDTLEAVHYYSSDDVSPGADVNIDHIPEDDRLAGGLPNFLNLSAGSRVMLIRNIMTDFGLVNGAMGTVVSLHFTPKCSLCPDLAIYYILNCLVIYAFHIYMCSELTVN